MQTNKIEVSKTGAGKTLYVPLSVYRTPSGSLTISCADKKHQFKFGTSDNQLRQFANKLNEIFGDRVKIPN